MSVPEFAPFIGLMIGLGVGIDYALLIVTRYREQLHADHTVRESVQIAIDTAGRSVLFAGLTVVISLLGMILMGISFVSGLAVSASATVAVTVIASLTLLPALLGFAGENVERTRWRGLIAAGFVAIALAAVGLDLTPLTVGLPLAGVAIAATIIAGFFVPVLKQEVQHRPPKPRRETLAYRWSRVIQRRPWTAAIASSVALLVAGRPGARPAPGLLGREQLRGGHHHAPGVRPARRRLRRGLQRPALPRGRAARGHERAVPGRRPQRPGAGPVASPRSSARSRTTTAPRRCGTSRPPGARRPRTPSTSSTACGTTCCPRSRTTQGWT